MKSTKVSDLKIGDVFILEPNSYRCGISINTGNKFVVLNFVDEHLTISAISDPEGYKYSFWQANNISFEIEGLKSKSNLSDQGKWFRDAGLHDGYCCCGVIRSVCDYHKE